MPRLPLVSATNLLLCLVLAPVLWAHDSADFMRHRQAPLATPLVLAGGSYASTSAFASNGISLLGWVPLSDFAGSHSSAADCWGYVAPSGREYAIIGLSDGVAFVELSDPGQPVVIETFPAVSSLWRDVKVYQDHAYFVSEGGDGVQIVDMSAIDSGVLSLVGSVNAAGTSASHNVAINADSGFLYQLGGGGFPVEGMRIYSLADKDNPVLVGEWDQRYIHDAQIVTYTSGPWAGKEIAFCFSENEPGGGAPGVDILDVTNKNNIVSISQLTYSTPVFSHQGWVSPDKQTLYINDELDESSFGTLTTTRVIDISDLDFPVQVSTFTSGSTAIDHNLYTKGDLIYEANYRSGLRVFDASDPTSPVETAFFDTYEADDNAEFNGLWSVFPYFDSATIVGSDLEKGLFVWRLGGAELILSPPVVPELLSAGGASLDISITAQPGFSVMPGSGRLYVDSGAGFVVSALTALGGSSYRADFPVLPCGQPVRWYVSARTTEGVTWQLPSGAPSAVFGASVGNSVQTLLSTELESNAGWSVGAPGDTASTGIWTRVNPFGTAAQPEDDHTPGGSDCYVTGQGFFGGGLGDDDVDNGGTTLRTDIFDLSSGDATVSYWRWYSNSTSAGPGADILEVDVSNDGGASWIPVEVVGPAGSEAVGGWFQHAFRVSDLLAPTSQMQLRFVASDLGSPSIVEAAIDDFEVRRFDCDEVCQADLGFGGPGTAGLSICGEVLDSGKTATLSLTGAAPHALAVLFISLGLNPVPFKGGTLATLPILMDVAFSTDGVGGLEFPIPGGGGPVTVYAQFVIADGNQIHGAALSNALEIQFGP